MFQQRAKSAGQKRHGLWEVGKCAGDEQIVALR